MLELATKENPKGKSPSLGVNKAAWTTHKTVPKSLKNKKKGSKKKQLQEIFWIAKMRLKFKCSNKAKDKNTIWKPLGLFVLFIWFWYGISLAALQKGKIYINIYTDLNLHRMALVKGYIFPLQLKINKMVSNIPPVLLFYLGLFQ